MGSLPFSISLRGFVLGLPGKERWSCTYIALVMYVYISALNLTLLLCVTHRRMFWWYLRGYLLFGCALHLQLLPNGSDDVRSWVFISRFQQLLIFFCTSQLHPKPRLRQYCLCKVGARNKAAAASWPGIGAFYAQIEIEKQWKDSAWDRLCSSQAGRLAFCWAKD